MSTSSLEQRLTRIQQLTAAALLLLFAGVSIWISATALDRQDTATAARVASQVAASIAEEERETPDRRAAIAEALADNASDGAGIQVFDAEGREIAFGGRRAAAGEGRRESHASLAGGGWVVASVSTEPSRRAVLDLAGALFVTGLPLLFLASAMSRTIARRALRPLSRIATQAEGISWNGALPSFRGQGDPAEVSALAQAFDRLLARLDSMLRTERSFAEDAAHELRTPVTVLRGEIEYAKQDPDTPASVLKALDRALDQARGMGELVEALLLLRMEARPDAAKHEELRQPVNLGDLVRDLEWEFRGRWPERADDLLVTADDEVLVAGHATLLASAVRNLLSNAFKFTARGQRVQVSVHHGDGRASVVVEDGGPGIPPADRARVFDPFFRGAEARGAHPGFGLGLPILRRVAAAHGGDLVVSTSALGGARFELRLPAWESLPALLPS